RWVCVLGVLAIPACVVKSSTGGIGEWEEDRMSNSTTTTCTITPAESLKQRTTLTCQFYKNISQSVIAVDRYGREQVTVAQCFPDPAHQFYCHNKDGYTFKEASGNTFTIELLHREDNSGNYGCHLVSQENTMKKCSFPMKEQSDLSPVSNRSAEETQKHGGDVFHAAGMGVIAIVIIVIIVLLATGSVVAVILKRQQLRKQVLRLCICFSKGEGAKRNEDGEPNDDTMASTEEDKTMLSETDNDDTAQKCSESTQNRASSQEEVLLNIVNEQDQKLDPDPHGSLPRKDSS
ncbi:hypothetical protein BaRGS_00039499, partial [Batillaria attramentaria]